MGKSAELATILKLHREWLESGNKSGRRADFSGAKLDGAKLSQADLSGALLRGASLQNADLSGSKLVHADFTDAILNDANLARANLLLADFTGAELKRADLFQTSVSADENTGPIKRGPRFKDANLDGANLSQSYCFASDFSGARLIGVRFPRARLEQANFSLNDLTDLDFSGANLSHARLESAVLRGANLQKTVLTEAKLQSANLSECDLRRADLTSANLAHAKVDGMQYNRQTRFRGIRLEGCYGSSRFRRFAEDQDFIEEFKEAHPNYYRIWMGLTDCGRSLVRVILWSLALSVFFGVVYFALGEGAFAISNEDGLRWNIFTSVYYSVVTFTTLGFGDITPRTPVAAGIVMIEVVIGYVMLGILISILATKVARRS